MAPRKPWFPTTSPFRKPSILHGQHFLLVPVTGSQGQTNSVSQPMGRWGAIDSKGPIKNDRAPDSDPCRIGGYRTRLPCFRAFSEPSPVFETGRQQERCRNWTKPESAFHRADHHSSQHQLWSQCMTIGGRELNVLSAETCRPIPTIGVPDCVWN